MENVEKDIKEIMKELSIKEKAQRYDEAIEQLRTMMPNWERLSYNGKTFLQDLVHIIPELAESEDERIRKELIQFFSDKDESDYEGLPPRTDIIAYLEKQGEQKFEQKFFINDKVVHKATGKIWTIHHYLKNTNSYYVEDNDGLLHHYRESELKLVEQKPTEWSEEDEKHIHSIISTIECCKAQFKEAIAVIEQYDSDLDYLKSLKDRVGCKVNCTTTWKPSDEQICVLSRSLEYINTISPNYCHVLGELLNQLKKLKG